MVAIILFVLLAILLIVNVPVGIALGISTMGALIYSGTLSLASIPQALVTSCDSFPILAIPLFILSGDLMGAGGVSSRVLNVCNVFFGRISLHVLCSRFRLRPSNRSSCRHHGCSYHAEVRL